MEGYGGMQQEKTRTRWSRKLHVFAVLSGAYICFMPKAGGISL